MKRLKAPMSLRHRINVLLERRNGRTVQLAKILQIKYLLSVFSNNNFFILKGAMQETSLFAFENRDVLTLRCAHVP